MRVGVQFTGSLGPNQTGRWFTFNWPEGWHVAWYMMPITPALGAPELQWDVAVERGDPQRVTYWLTVTNLAGKPINFEGRYAVLN
jgi:hypothetical protein